MRFLALAVSALAFAGCGSGSENGPAAGDSDSTLPTRTEGGSTVTEPQQARLLIPFYFVRDAKVGIVRRHLVTSPDTLGRAIVAELLAGPSSAERAAGLKTAIPAGTRLESLAIEDGVATVQLSRSLEPLAAAQIVYTLTQLRSVKRVVVGGGSALARSDLEEQTPPILVESPAPFDEISSPVRVTGTANTFEATFNVEVLDSEGRLLGKRFVTATSGSGTRGTFDATVPFKAPQTALGTVVVFETSAEDGSRTHEVEIPVGFD